jgi:mannose-6-phosphate isomerase-like protein (cupin superfamily)
MKTTIIAAAAAAFVGGAALAAALTQTADAKPTCDMCPAYFVPNSEIEEYLTKAKAEKLIDQQVRDVDIGKSHVAVGLVHRTRLTEPAPDSVAEHDLVSEVYHVISGAATLVTGPDLVGAQRRPATNENVRLLNGPGSNGRSIRNGESHELRPGDVIVIPAGTGHWFTRIDDHITYLMIRIDPDEVTPIKDAAASKAYLSKPAR